MNKKRKGGPGDSATIIGKLHCHLYVVVLVSREIIINILRAFLRVDLRYKYIGKILEQASQFSNLEFEVTF